MIIYNYKLRVRERVTVSLTLLFYTLSAYPLGKLVKKKGHAFVPDEGGRTCEKKKVGESADTVSVLVVMA